jgi:hypothetical protein
MDGDIGMEKEVTKREAWLKAEIAKIKSGQPMRAICVMSTPDRIEAGLCFVQIPEDRVRRGQDTCGAECQADKRRIRRWLLSRDKCRVCGHGMPKEKKSRTVRSAQIAAIGESLGESLGQRANAAMPRLKQKLEAMGDVLELSEEEWGKFVDGLPRDEFLALITIGTE